MKHENHTIMEGMINDVLNEVAKAADKLERQLDDHLFDNAMHEHEKVLCLLHCILVCSVNTLLLPAAKSRLTVLEKSFWKKNRWEDI